MRASSTEGKLIGIKSKPRSDDTPSACYQPPLKIKLFSSEGLGSVAKKVHVGTQTISENISSKITSKDRQTEDDSSPQVSVRVDWECGVREKKLPKALQSLGKMLVRGTFKQIAIAAWHCADLRPHIISQFLGTIHKEMDAICSRKKKIR